MLSPKKREDKRKDGRKEREKGKEGRGGERGREGEKEKNYYVRRRICYYMLIRLIAVIISLHVHIKS